MPVPEYSKARKLAQKAYRQDIAAGRYPYPKVLDEFLPFAATAGETDLGLIEIPLQLVAGTKTSGRTKAFASNFMPLLDEDSEFAEKWSSLYRSHIEEGIREPVIACEFMNSYYIIEGNKRVSVLRYTGALSVSGYVTRILPAKDGSDEVAVYYEFVEFNRFSRINTVYFSRPGGFRRLCSLTGKEFGAPWSEEERRDFSSCLLHLETEFAALGGAALDVTPGDALLLYLRIYGYAGMIDKSPATLRKELETLWEDLKEPSREKSVSLIMAPEQEPEKNLIQKLIAPAPPLLETGFLYYKTAESSDWTYGHDLGRHYLENHMADRVRIHIYDGIETEEESDARIEEAVADGCSVIFTTSPRFLGSSIRAGIRHPQIKILNCSLNTYSGHLRTYYGRLYEAKFLVGMIAGILTRTDHIGYIADFPIYGATASINAFALGVRMVNPSATVHLAWSAEKNCDISALFAAARVSHVSGRDLLAPLHSPRKYGLYDQEAGESQSLATAIWHWGRFYQRILQTILNGNWNRTSGAYLGESINYWWGLSSGMIDLICSASVPARTRQLVELVRKQIETGEFSVFSGEIYDQAHRLRTREGESLNPEQIIRMDWLADNVEGRIPRAEDLVAEAAPMVQIQGIFSEKDGM